MAYTPPGGDKLAFPFSRSYTAPTGNELSFPLADFDSGAGLPIARADSYALFAGTTLNVPAPGVLANDVPAGATLALHSAPIHGILSLHSDGSFSYTPTSGYSGPDSFTYDLSNAAGTATATATVTLTIALLPPVMRYIATETKMPYQPTSRLPIELASGWSMRDRANAEPSMTWETAARCSISTLMPWARDARVAAGMRSIWGMRPREAVERATSWNRDVRIAAAASSAWQLARQFPSTDTTASWIARPTVGSQLSALSLVRPRAAASAASTWTLRQRTPLRTCMPWGYAPRVPWLPHSPGIDVPPVVPPAPYYVPPRGDRLALPIQCLYSPPKGDQLYLPIGPFACYAASLGRRRYIVLNSAAVVRLPERTPIPVSAITLASSVDDVAWSVSITLADPALKAIPVARLERPAEHRGQRQRLHLDGDHRILANAIEVPGRRCDYDRPQPHDAAQRALSDAARLRAGGTENRTTAHERRTAVQRFHAGLRYDRLARAGWNMDLSATNADRRNPKNSLCRGRDRSVASVQRCPADPAALADKPMGLGVDVAGQDRAG
ncbi:MAG: cadherin-like domain-containing protein [Rudaea sp.]|nr:cadherin-like domain-containing protein [Rudaea sp.]